MPGARDPRFPSVAKIIHLNQCWPLYKLFHDQAPKDYRKHPRFAFLTWFNEKPEGLWFHVVQASNSVESALGALIKEKTKEG